MDRKSEYIKKKFEGTKKKVGRRIQTKIDNSLNEL